MDSPRTIRVPAPALADLVIGAGDIRVLLNLDPPYDLGDLVAKIDRIDAELLNSLLTPTSRRRLGAAGAGRARGR